MKKIYTYFLWILFSLSFAFCLTGCFPVLDLEPRETSDLSVVQLIHRQNNVVDPSRKWRSADSYYMRLRVSLTGKESKDYYTSEIWYQHPKCFRLATKKNGQYQKILIYNDDRVWSINAWNNRSTELKAGSLEYELFLNTVRMGTPSLNYTDIFRRISIDRFIENNTTYYRMICMSDDKRIQPYIFYYNGNTFLQEKLETVNIVSQSGAAVLYTSRVEKYTNIDGIILPERTIVESGGVTQISELQEIAINEKYPETLFLPTVPLSHRMPLPDVKTSSASGKKNTVIEKSHNTGKKSK